MTSPAESKSLTLALVDSISSHKALCRRSRQVDEESIVSPEVTAAIVGGMVALVTALLTVVVTARQQRRQFQLDLEKLRHEAAEDFLRDRDQSRTQFMAERVAVELIQETTFSFRTFEQIAKRLGGFEEDELRRILVRAGAVRFEGREELWGLLSRPEVRAALRSQSPEEEMDIPEAQS